MKIIQLTAENVKKIRAVEITPKGDLVQITGRNDQGKTTILDAIWWALAGTKSIQAAPIRKGQDKARIRLALGGEKAELIVERRFTAGGASTLYVENAEGARFKSPQAMLDAMIDAIAFDPIGFVDDPPPEQFKTLRGLVKLDVDIDQLDGLNRHDFEDRAGLNRDAKSARANADAIKVPDNLPEAMHDVKAIIDEIAEAGQANAHIASERARRVERSRVLDTIEAGEAKHLQEIAELEAQVEEIRQRIGSDNKTVEIGRAELGALVDLPPPVDVVALRRKLDEASADNKGIEARGRKMMFLRDAAAAEAAAKERTDAMAARDEVKRKAIEGAKMPVDGLGFGDGIVTFNGLPFDQASTAQQVRVSLAIAMAANPKLRVIRIKQGNDLDPDNLAIVAAMAKEHDYQVWIERIDVTGKIGIQIEDGAVVAIDGEKLDGAGGGGGVGGSGSESLPDGSVTTDASGKLL